MMDLNHINSHGLGCWECLKEKYGYGSSKFIESFFINREWPLGRNVWYSSWRNPITIAYEQENYRNINNVR
jgi:hypothetical protein